MANRHTAKPTKQEMGKEGKLKKLADLVGSEEHPASGGHTENMKCQKQSRVPTYGSPLQNTSILPGTHRPW